MDDQSLPSIYLPTRRQWRDWLKKNHDKLGRIWLIYYKKHTGKPSIPYNDAVEEALCYGWIDSTVRRIDDERYMQQFTPRKKKSNWSKTNVRRMEKLISEGKMTDTGLALYDFAKEHDLLPDMDEDSGGKGEQIFHKVPAWLNEALKKHPNAEKFFDGLAPSYKLQYLGWILSAKREETRIRRLKEAIGLMESGRKLGMK